MSCIEDVMALTSAGYKMNPYIGQWSKNVGGRLAFVAPNPKGGAYVELWNDCQPRKAEWCQTLARAIEAGEKWLEARDAE